MDTQRALAIDLTALPEGGSVVFPEATGHLPGLKGRLNPIRDTHDRTYLCVEYRDRRGQTPVHFIPGEELLTYMLCTRRGSSRGVRSQAFTKQQSYAA